jgi:outer membrane receptor protein involved in Fe transport
MGPHTFRAGVDFLDNETAITYPRSFRGSYSFSSLTNFLQGTYNNSGFTQTFGPSSISQNNPNLGLFAQDEWKLSSQLTLNLGVRYDVQFLDSIAIDTNNISPRAGFALAPFASRRTVIRGSFGLFYDRVPLRALANALLSAGNTSDPSKLRQISVTLSPGQTGAPVFPNILNALTPTLGNFTTMNPHMQNAYSEQSSAGIEQQIGTRGTFSVEYQHLRGLHLIAAVNQNVPTCVASGGNNGCRPNSGYANNSQYSPAADSRFNALNVSFVQRPSRWGSYRISYSYSKALDDVGEFFFSAPIDNFDIWQDWSRSDDDQRHRITVDGVAHSHGFEWSGMLQYYSALPLNITSGVTTIQGTAGRPIVKGVFLSRNAGIGNDFFSLGTRLRRTFSITERVRLDAMAEAFNLLNHRNNLTINGAFGSGAYPSSPSSSFGQITAVNDSRVMQLVLRMGF